MFSLPTPSRYHQPNINTEDEIKNYLKTLSQYKHNQIEFSLQRSSSKFLDITDSMFYGLITVLRYFNSNLPELSRETYRRKISLEIYFNNNWSVYEKILNNLILKHVKGITEDCNLLTSAYLHYKNTGNVDEAVEMMNTGLFTYTNKVLFLDNFIIVFHRPQSNSGDGGKLSPKIIITEQGKTVVVCVNTITDKWKARLVLKVLHTQFL